MTTESNESAGLFNDQVAPHYDAAAAAMFADEVLGPTVDFLAEIAHRGRALEFASGTGRVALPLSAQGIEVHGIELSQPMLDQMLAKRGADNISVTIGDMATTTADGTFGLVYLVYNTIGNLLGQAEQVRCFANASAHLEPGGCFVIEMYIPGLRKLPLGETFVPFEVTPSHLGIDEYDVANQQLVSHHYYIDGDKTTTFNTPQRYAWPAELDLMAQLAGLTLRERYGDWNREPFTSDSTSHISVWQK